MKPLDLICLFKTQENKEIDKVIIKNSGYVSLDKKKLHFSENMIKFAHKNLLLEIIKHDKYCTIMLLNYLETIKNKKIYDPHIFDNLPGLILGSRIWQLFTGDVIKYKNEVFLIGGVSYHKTLDIL